MAQRVKGIVHWFNDYKGYGYIIPSGQSVGEYEGLDYRSASNRGLVFAHYTAILGEGFKTLAEGQEVEFELIEGPKGPQAASICKVLR